MTKGFPFPLPFGRDAERGSALVLVPAGFLVLVMLAAMAVDSAVAFLGQRQLADALAAAANDAASAAIADPSFYASGAVVIDPVRADQVVCQTVAAQSDGDLHHVVLAVAVAGAAVGVRGDAEVDEVFGRALPGLHQRHVSALAVAVASQGPVTADSVALDYQRISC
ncbi:MAG TPA: hypothetical protein VG184_05705 [Acidimicrobiales bacterium]|jgi:hypothetical protein|nr:hypothetical protein [Acidimicrobiales bacterium]